MTRRNDDFDSLGKRMKEYEHSDRRFLMKKTPVIVRIDGKAFHTLTRGMKRPFDDDLMACMRKACLLLSEEMMGCAFSYTQSDEASFLLTDYAQANTEGWFGYNKSKIESVSASMFTVFFNKELRIRFPEKQDAFFDSRAFSLPKEEVINYFIWRQQDATRNSIQMIARANFSHKQCDHKNTKELQEMLFSEKGINFNDYAATYKRGTSFYKQAYTRPNEYFGKYPGQSEIVTRHEWLQDPNLPVFTKDREYVERWVYSTSAE